MTTWNTTKDDTVIDYISINMTTYRKAYRAWQAAITIISVSYFEVNLIGSTGNLSQKID